MPRKLDDKTRKAHFSLSSGKEDGDTRGGDQEATCKGGVPITLRPSVLARGRELSRWRVGEQGHGPRVIRSGDAFRLRLLGSVPVVTHVPVRKDRLNHPQGSGGTELPDGQQNVWLKVTQDVTSNQPALLPWDLRAGQDTACPQVSLGPILRC